MAADEPNAPTIAAARPPDYAEPPSGPPEPSALEPRSPARVVSPPISPPVWAPPPLSPELARAAPPPAAAGVSADPLLHKLQLEAAMHAAPREEGPRAAYFQHLSRMAAGHTGLLTALLPELGAPLYLRGGTPDIAVLASVFRDQKLAIELKAAPSRILVLGAYAGYTAVDLARRHPRASILAVEPLPDNYRLLLLNTAAIPRIATAPVAAWHNATRLAPTLRYQADWAVRLHDQDYAEERTIEALGVKGLLELAGWSDVDMVLCDASGAEREVFANPTQAWLGRLETALVVLHEGTAPRATEWVAKALGDHAFEHRVIAGMDLFQRRGPARAPSPRVPPLHLVRGEPGLARFGLVDVPATPQGFFLFDGPNCQLHPNPPGAKPARALFAVQGDGHQGFRSELRHFGAHASPIIFTAAVHRADGVLMGHGEVTLAERERGELAFEFDARLRGAARVMLQTAMAPGAANATRAWAHWYAPRLV